MQGFCISQRQTYFRVFFRMTGGKRLTYVMRLEMSLLRDPTIVCKLRKACSSYMCETMEICEEKNFSRIEYRRFRIFLRCVIFRNFFQQYFYFFVANREHFLEFLSNIVSLQLFVIQYSTDCNERKIRLVFRNCFTVPVSLDCIKNVCINCYETKLLFFSSSICYIKFNKNPLWKSIDS